MNENITEDILQCKSKELKGMYKCNILLQTPYAVHFIKKNVYKAPAPFPAAVYLYKSVTNTPLLINLQLHRKGRRKRTYNIKTISSSLGIQCLVFQVEHVVKANSMFQGPMQTSDRVELAIGVL